MTRLSKKASAAVASTGTKPITDFFARTSASAPSSKAKKLSSQSVCANPTKAFVSSGKNVSISSAYIRSVSKPAYTDSDASFPATPCSSSAFLDVVKVASPDRSASKTQYLMPPSLPIMKRASSKLSRTGSLSPHPSPGRSRNPVFDSDSDLEGSAPAVYIFRSPPPSAFAADVAVSAPVHLRATEDISHSSQIRIHPKKKRRLSSPEPCSDLVPTSQSDELEISPAHLPQRDPTQVQQIVEEWRHNAASATSLLPEKPFFNVPSPIGEGSPSSDDVGIPPLPSTPQALDPTTKAERIIAEIKARAYAATLQNQSEISVREFKDELSDSDDDVFPESPIKDKRKAVATTLQTASSKRHSLRTREPSPSPSTKKRLSGPLAATARSRVASTHVPANQNVKDKSKNWNPLDDLLKEKRQNDQRGKGFEAFRQAEAALANRDVMVFDADDEDFTDEAAARKAVMERNHLTSTSSSPGGYDASDSEEVVNEHDHQRLLGEKHGKAVANLLNCDKASRQKEKDIEKPVGVPLWHVNEDAMDVDEATLPKLDISTSHPLLLVLHDAIDRNDITQAALLISSGCISSIYIAENPVFIPYLCGLALLAEGTVLSKSAIQALTQLWETSLHAVPGISFACILATLARLGAQPTIVNATGWRIPTTNTTFIPPNKRDSLLYRLIVLINTSAQSRRLCHEETPDILLAIILIANDPSSSAELQREAVLAIHAVCGSIASGCDISTSLQRYSDLPPILPLLGELTRERSTAAEPLGKFEQHDDTDFVDMTFYVGILGVAITNIAGYVMEEHKTPRASSSGNVTTNQPREAPLVLLRTAIETLHARICKRFIK
ncbi:hypothetical protein C0993_000719 [Termitomyces sp. T159_Od127]|nr:hypothetical protein C0993_000719 [Termitomyces sp. T159_Od127]